MSQARQLALENAALRDRLSRLSAASLRINESLDFGTVLQEVLDSARSLTGAHYGIITTLNPSGETEDVVTSGLTPAECEGLWALPGGLGIFESLRQMTTALRTRDLNGLISSLGLPDFHPPMPLNSFLGTPMRSRGVRVGTFYLAEKRDGPEFSLEDEETLVMFASQAALVLSNARQYRDERKARADLEALIDTSPVGVVVLDAEAGSPVSFNREARRIFRALEFPNGPVEHLLEVTTVGRADGRQIPLSELPFVRVLEGAETVRAEEMVFKVPDGRSVSALVNATPIHSPKGGIESFVVTL